MDLPELPKLFIDRAIVIFGDIPGFSQGFIIEKINIVEAVREYPSDRLQMVEIAGDRLLGDVDPVLDHYLGHLVILEGYKLFILQKEE